MGKQVFQDNIWWGGRELAMGLGGTLLAVSASCNGVYKFDKAAGAWSALNLPHLGRLYSVVADPLTPGRFYVCVVGNESPLQNGEGGLFRTDDDGAIWNNWDITGAEPPEWAKPMLGEGARINQTLHIRWHAPATMALFITLDNAATGEAIVPPMANPHIITPETQGSSHYFFTRDHGEEAEALFRKAFLEEDEPMVEAVHERLGGEDFWDARPLILPTDKAAVMVRRRLMQLRRAEAG